MDYIPQTKFSGQSPFRFLPTEKPKPSSNNADKLYKFLRANEWSTVNAMTLSLALSRTAVSNAISVLKGLELITYRVGKRVRDQPNAYREYSAVDKPAANV